jgi:hypothetical protein
VRLTEGGGRAPDGRGRPCSRRKAAAVLQTEGAVVPVTASVDGERARVHKRARRRLESLLTPDRESDVKAHRQSQTDVKAHRQPQTDVKKHHRQSQTVVKAHRQPQTDVKAHRQSQPLCSRGGSTPRCSRVFPRRRLGLPENLWTPRLKWLFFLDLSMVDRRLHDDLRKI